jgi:hypothetical protein
VPFDLTGAITSIRYLRKPKQSACPKPFFAYHVGLHRHAPFRPTVWFMLSIRPIGRGSHSVPCLFLLISLCRFSQNRRNRRGTADSLGRREIIRYSFFLAALLTIRARSLHVCFFFTVSLQIAVLHIRSQVTGVPLLILANKQDLALAM